MNSPVSRPTCGGSVNSAARGLYALSLAFAGTAFGGCNALLDFPSADPIDSSTVDSQLDASADSAVDASTCLAEPNWGECVKCSGLLESVKAACIGSGGACAAVCGDIKLKDLPKSATFVPCMECALATTGCIATDEVGETRRRVAAACSSKFDVDSGGDTTADSTDTSVVDSSVTEISTDVGSDVFDIGLDTRDTATSDVAPDTDAFVTDTRIPARCELVSSDLLVEVTDLPIGVPPTPTFTAALPSNGSYRSTKRLRSGSPARAKRRLSVELVGKTGAFTMSETVTSPSTGSGLAAGQIQLDGAGVADWIIDECSSPAPNSLRAVLGSSKRLLMNYTFTAGNTLTLYVKDVAGSVTVVDTFEKE